MIEFHKLSSQRQQAQSNGGRPQATHAQIRDWLKANPDPKKREALLQQDERRVKFRTNGPDGDQ